MAAVDVLIVEDDTDIRETLEDVLDATGYTVATAPHGAAALKMLRTGLRPRLTLVDCYMPVMDGPTFLRTVLADPDLATLQVVMLSAYPQAFDTIDTSGKKLLHKPFELRVLLATVADSIEPPAATFVGSDA